MLTLLKKVGVCFTRVHSRYPGSYPDQAHIIDQHWYIHKLNQIGDENMKFRDQTPNLVHPMDELMGCSI